MLRTVRAIRYVTPLREGGSLPAVVEADDDGTYVLKFRGAGQGPKALIAELVAGEIGRALGLPVPEIVLMDLDPAIGRSEPDPEIKALIEASPGLNLALDFLPGALSFDPIIPPDPDPGLASSIVWFDAYVTNVDRTARNTNILVWHQHLWLIDHGAALYFHHRWDDYLARSKEPFAAIRHHVMLRSADGLDRIDDEMRGLLKPDVLRAIVDAIPEQWLQAGPLPPDGARLRVAYLAYLVSRLESSHMFVEEAQRARALLL
jgi:hypothetical protein